MHHVACFNVFLQAWQKFVRCSIQECKDILKYELETNPEATKDQVELLKELELVPGLEFLKQPFEAENKRDLIRLQAKAA